MSSNRYAPPSAVVADLEPVPLKRRNILVMILLMIVTLGLYAPIWFLRRRDALNHLDSPRKLAAWPQVVFIVILVMYMAAELMVVLLDSAVISLETATAVLSIAPLLALARFGAAILMLLQCFKTRDILEDHLAGPADGMRQTMFAEERVKLSGVLTFILQVLYLQHSINRHHAAFQRRPATAQPTGNPPAII